MKILYMFRFEQVPLPGIFTGNNDIFQFHYTSKLDKINNKIANFVKIISFFCCDTFLALKF